MTPKYALMLRSLESEITDLRTKLAATAASEVRLRELAQQIYNKTTLEGGFSWRAASKMLALTPSDAAKAVEGMVEAAETLSVNVGPTGPVHYRPKEWDVLNKAIAAYRKIFGNNGGA